MDWQPLIVVLIIALVIALAVYHYRRTASILQNWAARNGLRIISSSRCWFWVGPFFLRSGRSQDVYRVTVEDSAGRVRKGYVRCGDSFFWMFSDRAHVVWDREPEYRPGFPVVFPDRKDK